MRWLTGKFVLFDLYPAKAGQRDEAERIANAACSRKRYKMRELIFQRAVSIVLAFEMYMIACGSTFPVFSYMFRTVVGAMLLGSCGLLLSFVTKSTVVGYLSAFCFYFVSQSDFLNSLLHVVSEGANISHLFLIGISGGIVLGLC